MKSQYSQYFKPIRSIAQVIVLGSMSLWVSCTSQDSPQASTEIGNPKVVQILNPDGSQANSVSYTFIPASGGDTLVFQGDSSITLEDSEVGFYQIETEEGGLLISSEDLIDFENESLEVQLSAWSSLSGSAPIEERDLLIVGVENSTWSTSVKGDVWDLRIPEGEYVVYEQSDTVRESLYQINLTEEIVGLPLEGCATSQSESFEFEELQFYTDNAPELAMIQGFASGIQEVQVRTSRDTVTWQAESGEFKSFVDLTQEYEPIWIQSDLGHASCLLMRHIKEEPKAQVTFVIFESSDINEVPLLNSEVYDFESQSAQVKFFAKMMQSLMGSFIHELTGVSSSFKLNRDVNGEVEVLRVRLDATQAELIGLPANELRDQHYLPALDSLKRDVGEIYYTIAAFSDWDGTQNTPSLSVGFGDMWLVNSSALWSMPSDISQMSQYLLDTRSPSDLGVPNVSWGRNEVSKNLTVNLGVGLAGLHWAMGVIGVEGDEAGNLGQQGQFNVAEEFLPGLGNDAYINQTAYNLLRASTWVSE